MAVFTLTQAITTMALGQAQTAAEFRSDQIAEWSAYDEGFRSRARTAYQLAREAGLPEGWHLTNDHAAEAERIPEIRELIVFRAERDARQEQRNAAIKGAIHSLLEGAWSGTVTLSGVLNESERAEKIGSADLVRLAYNEGLLDSLVASDNPNVIWKSVTVNPEEFYRWRKTVDERQAADGVPAPYTAKAEKVATTILTQIIREQQDALTRGRAAQILKDKEIVVSGSVFKSRVWPGARKAAGLNPQAPPGRRKSSKANRLANLIVQTISGLP
jgi:hypothetical protein